MTNWFFHLLGGLFFTTLALAGYVYFIEGLHISLELVFTVCLGLGIGSISSLVPDIDNRKSVGFRGLNILFLILLFGSSFMTFGLLYKQWIVALVAPFVVFIVWFFLLSRLIIPRHRAYIHSIVAMLIWGGMIGIGTGSPILAVIAMIGFWSHLCLDLIPLKII